MHKIRRIVIAYPPKMPGEYHRYDVSRNPGRVTAKGNLSTSLSPAFLLANPATTAGCVKVLFRQGRSRRPVVHTGKRAERMRVQMIAANLLC